MIMIMIMIMIMGAALEPSWETRGESQASRLEVSIHFFFVYA
jgi:hypothetical protein